LGVDSRPPFATSTERLRLLYRLPLTGRETRILVIGSQAEADAVFDPASQHTTVDAIQAGATTTLSNYDVVALPGSLLRINSESGGVVQARSGPPEQLLRLAYSVLRPGGIVVGHLDHLLSAHGLRQTVFGRIGIGSWVRCRPLISAPRCLGTLMRMGFEGSECFYVEPQIAAPMTVVPIHPLAARSHFLRAIRRTRDQYSLPGFVLRMALAHVRLGGALQPHLFFWARRPC
jgi:hypothetical protein